MHPSQAEYSNSIFWIDVDKIHPNPYQPRREFDEERLADLAESIRQYGVLQPLVVTRQEEPKPDGGMAVSYELIAGERRLRASKLAGLSQVPAVIRKIANDSRTKLELAIIENIQREDLNPVERARAFHQLADEFKFKHVQIADRIHRSREYVSNTLRLLALPADMLDALSAGKISEGHTRPLLMLSDRPEEQRTLFKEILLRKLTVRDVEQMARKIAFNKVRKKDKNTHPETFELEESLTEQLGARVQIEHKEVGGKITINFDSDADLKVIIERLMHEESMRNAAHASPVAAMPALAKEMLPEEMPEHEIVPMPETEEKELPDILPAHETASFISKQFDESAKATPIEREFAEGNTNAVAQPKESEEDLYNIKNFSV